MMSSPEIVQAESWEVVNFITLMVYCYVTTPSFPRS